MLQRNTLWSVTHTPTYHWASTHTCKHFTGLLHAHMHTKTTPHAPNHCITNALFSWVGWSHLLLPSTGKLLAMDLLSHTDCAVICQSSMNHWEEPVAMRLVDRPFLMEHLSFFQCCASSISDLFSLFTLPALSAVMLGVSQQSRSQAPDLDPALASGSLWCGWCACSWLMRGGV